MKLLDHQCCFRRNRSTTDQTFCFRQILEKKWEYNETLHKLFVDFKKACDSVRTEVLYILPTSTIAAVVQRSCSCAWSFFLSGLVLVFWLCVSLACENAMYDYCFPVFFLLLWPGLLCRVWHFFEWLCRTVFLAISLFTMASQPTGPIQSPRPWVQSDRSVKLIK
jgi:hypothetical protein